MRNSRPIGLAAVAVLAATLAVKAYDSGTRELSLILVIAVGGAVLIYLLTPYRFSTRDPDTPRKSWDPSQMEDDADEQPPSERKGSDAS